ncbi:hypothetical protein BDN72DRAFT_945701 [Pluteus cervinus]|uniref:Uncharacterized protein n=1 Tax=Pluteus cervinus TaxID=181527 RepID=A0ACD3AUZ9_9AGAR|nr:hypothetical protein BDN72DRAFT_945701 [Pluteus cervinus]
MFFVDHKFRDVAADYMKRHFKVDRILKPFFFEEEVLPFRHLQEDLGVVISGSAALQFFDRVKFAGSDLDLYVHHSRAPRLMKWLEENGFCKKVIVAWTDNESEDVTRDPFMMYLDKSIASITNFKRFDAVVQVIAVQTTVIETVLNFGLTCVMNIITHREAISFYPDATFERREALISHNELAPKSRNLFDKYQKRGWTILDYLTTAQRWDRKSDFYCASKPARIRCVGDKRCWIIRLPSKEFGVGHDLKHINTWVLKPSKDWICYGLR